MYSERKEVLGHLFFLSVHICTYDLDTNVFLYFLMLKKKKYVSVNINRDKFKTKQYF